MSTDDRFDGSQPLEERPFRNPTDEEVQRARQEAHKDHLDWFYGDYWDIFIDKRNRFFLEHDVGHLDTKFIITEISETTYNLLKAEPSRFDELRFNGLF